MAKKIYPGNYVNRLSSYQGQPAVCVPGRVYHHVTGYALGTATGGTSFDVVIPSPDQPGDDKPRADIVGLTVPTGANVYFVGLRVPDMRKDRGVGSAFSGLVGTNTNRLKVADALANDNSITSTVVATNSASVAVASGTVAPVAAAKSLVTAATLAGSETLKVFVTDSSGTSAGATLTSSLAGGTPLIVEVAYFLDDAVGDLGDVSLPYITES
jgi:hypothetical protein